MRPRAPGWLWLLAHELRLSWRSTKASFIRLGIIIGFFWLLLHAGAWFVMGQPERMIQGQMIAAAGFITWFMLFFTLATAFGLGIVALFERGDFDLLLASPIAPRTVFAVRGLGVAVQSIAIMAVFWLPFANAAVMHGHWRMLASYLVMASAGLGATALAFAATLALVRAFGVRRAKVIAQVLGALAGAIIFIVSQASNFVADDRKREFYQWLRSDDAQGWIGPHSWLWFPARAVFGDPLPLLAVAVVGIGLFMAVVILFERRFLEGTRESDARPVRAAKRVGPQQAFRSGLASIVIVKELRLIWRDPRLISQVLLQVLYLMPLAFVSWRHGRPVEILSAVVILISTTLAGNLAWMTVSGEEAPDLISSAPVSKQAVLWLKVAAALAGPAALGIPFVVFAGMESVSSAAIFALCFVPALASAAVVQAWTAKPGSPRELKKRMQSSRLAGIVEFFSAVGWAGACFAFLHGWIWGFAGVAIGILAPALVWVRRPDPLADPA